MTEVSINRIRNTKVMINDKIINRKNKKLMIDKILSYSPSLLEGVEKYNEANINFTIFILLSAVTVNIPILSFPCCIISIFYLIKMFELIKFRNIKSIVNVLGKDLAFKGIYDKGKVEDLLYDFSDKFGDDIEEYKLLTEMVYKYETFVTKIEWVINSLYVKNRKESNKTEISSKQIKNINQNEKIIENKSIDYSKNCNDKLALTYKNEAGEIKKINKAIEFFEDNDKSKNNSKINSNIGVLKSNKKGKESKLTVYLYKKASDIPDNAI